MHNGALQLRFARYFMLACVFSVGLFEIVALGLENVPLQRHPMDRLIVRLDNHVLNADIVVMGDSVTKSVVDWYDLGPSIANLTDNRSSGVIGMKFLLARYLEGNLWPRLIYIATTPETLTFVPKGVWKDSNVDAFDYFVGSVFTSSSERAWLNRQIPGYDEQEWTLAIFDVKRRLLRPLIAAIKTLSSIQPAKDGENDADVIVEQEWRQGRFVKSADLADRRNAALVLNDVAARALADMCLNAARSGVRLVFAWAPTPASVYENWRRESRLSSFQNSITTVYDAACSDAIFYDFNTVQNYPDHAFRDPEHLRRPVWTAIYARQLRLQFSENVPQ